MSVKKPKAIIFDWDNTIVVSDRLLFESLHYTLGKLGISDDILNSQKFRENAHLSARDGFPKIFGDSWNDVYKLYKNYLQKVHLHRVSLMPDAEKLIKLLAAQNITLAVVSNKDGDLVRAEAENFHMLKYFYSVIGSCDSEKDKPSPQAAYLALKGRFPKEEFNKDIWFVGDSVADIECAYNAGCTPILFDYGCNKLDYLDIHNIAQNKNITYYKVSSHNNLLSFFCNAK